MSARLVRWSNMVFFAGMISVPVGLLACSMSRRVLLATMRAAIGTVMLAGPARAQADARAAALVRSAAEQMVAIVNGSESMDEKKARLRQVIDSAVDVEGVGRFALGRFGRAATADQMREYIVLFHDVLLTQITSRIGAYQGGAFTMGATQVRDNGEHVMTVVMLPNNPPANVAWVVAEANGALKIVDVIVEGTSMRLTQRSDYASYLARNGHDVQALVGAMRQQITVSRKF
ncbi:MAG: ABC transporter substrate-binding protein [Acetobacteraceae bacterium]|nr:ABC transporter substrate-binding protein [Acetobacteraceae bacterium]